MLDGESGQRRVREATMDGGRDEDNFWRGTTSRAAAKATRRKGEPGRDLRRPKLSRWKDARIGTRERSARQGPASSRDTPPRGNAVGARNMRT